MKKIMLLFVTSIVAILLVACGEAEIEKKEAPEAAEQDNNQEVDAPDESDKDDAAEETVNDENLKVGETVVFDGVEITLNELRLEAGGEYDTPDEGKFVVANITVENTTGEEITVSSMLNFELKDDEGYSYSTTFLLEGVKAQLDGSVEAGGKLRGEIPFDVPEAERYELHYADPFKSGKAIWEVPAGELK